MSVRRIRSLSRSVTLTGIVASTLAACTALPPPPAWIAGEEKENSTRVPPIAEPSTEGRPGSEGPARREARAPLQSLSWPRALEIAHERSPTAHAARERILRARANLDEARALSWPRVDARASWVRFIEAANFRGRTGSDVSGQNTRTRFFSTGGTDIYSAGVDVSYPLFDGGDAYYARRESTADLEAAEFDEAQVLRDLELEVSAAYLNVLLARGAIQIAEDALRVATDQEALARVRAEAGEGLEVDALRFATRASEERLALNRARGERRVRIAILSELLDVPLDPELELVSPDSGIDLPEGSRVEVAFENRPELLASRARLRAASSRLAREFASRWPALVVFGSYGLISLDDIQLSSDEDELQIGSALSWNLFEGGASLARAEAIRREIEELRALERDLSLDIERELRAAEIDLEVARENVEVSREADELASEVLERVSAQYAAGEARVLDVTEAEAQRTSARLEHLRTEIELLLAEARLRRALGLTIGPSE